MADKALSRRSALTLLTAGGATALAVPFGAAPALAAPQKFRDVPPSNLFYAEIQWFAEQEITTGWPDGTFRPLASVNRDAMAAFLYRAAGRPTYTAPSRSPFRDLTPGTKFFKEICWLADEEISTGWRDGTFRHLTPVNRDAMAAFLYRSEGRPTYTPPARSPFRDVATSSEFYKEICWLADRKISTGWADRTFRPLQPIARDAMAAFFHRLAHNGSSTEATDRVASLIVTKVNEERSAVGRSTLRRDARIDTVARNWSAKLTRSFFEHNPDYYRQIPSGWSWTAENIAFTGVSTSASADAIAATLVEQWMTSRGHRDNILHEKFTTTGVGVARRDYSGTPNYFATQVFARY